MDKSATHPTLARSAELQRLAKEGRVKPPSRRLSDVLAEPASLTGPVSDAGSRAVQEQRGERG